jgi:hypothetical protein
VIDGIDQLGWLTAQQSESCRDGYVYWMGPEIYGVKWRNFKLVLVGQEHSTDTPARLSSPRILNLVTDPHERESYSLPHLHSWTLPISIGSSMASRRAWHVSRSLPLAHRLTTYRSHNPRA